MTRNLRLWTMVFALVLSLVFLGLLFTGTLRLAQEQTTSEEQRLRLANLAGRCEDTQEEGFGVFEVDRKFIVSDESGEITAPCRLSIEEGGSLTLEGVELETETLVIEDGDANGQTAVDIRGSTLTGTEQAGTYITLVDPADSITISNSDFNYPLGIDVRASGEQAEGDEGGSVEVTQSSLVSRDADTVGIRLMAGANKGTGTFVDLELDTVQLSSGLESKRILLLAGDCSIERVEGYSGACSPEDAVNMEQG